MDGPRLLEYGILAFDFSKGDAHSRYLGGGNRPSGDTRGNCKLQYVIISFDLESIWAINGKGSSIGQTCSYFAR
jgi:hypothetical protein